MAIKCGRANAEIDVFGHLAGGMVGDDEQAGAGRAGNQFMRLGNHRSDRTTGLLVRPSNVLKRWGLQGAAQWGAMRDSTRGRSRALHSRRRGMAMTSRHVGRLWKLQVNTTETGTTP